MNLNPDPLDRNRFPVDEWALVEKNFSGSDMGRTETLFAVGNGYLGLRGNVDEGRDAHAHGTFINGFHETWPIRHAEEAFGFARVGQTIVNAPDAKIIRIYVDDEPLVLTNADLLSYERRLDFADGVLSRELEWRTPSGKRVSIRSRRLVSFTERHLAILEYEVTMLDADASVVISSQILNRQDGASEYDASKLISDKKFDPRKAESFTDRVLMPRFKRASDGRYVLGFRCTNSGMTIACAADHVIETVNEYDVDSHIDDDLAKHVYRVKAKQGKTIRITKTLSYHTSTGVPTHELADRCDRTLDRAREEGTAVFLTQQREWLADFWARTDVVVHGQPALQQATRWNLFQLAQASMRADGQGVSAKGVSGSGYGGHYFWDTEVYVVPFLTYTSPNAARSALRFRHSMLDHARARATELNQLGALFPWRTINGLESSAYYAAGTAQYHIDADISYALSQYVAATGDEDFLAREAIDILVETARMWADLGFWRGNGKDVFHIHGVTGPDEYTTVVNDNLYTNIMARSNLRTAVTAVRRLRYIDVESYNSMVARLGLDLAEVAEWAFAAEAMHIPFDETLGIHPQDAQFLEKERWDLSKTPAAHRPLLLHYHPLVIYRFQVLKQADVVLALLLQGDQFTAEQKRADFDYYDPITTGDSTLSDVVQSIIAAEVGYHELALKYFTSGLFVDLADLHHNAADGVHVASAGGVWSALVYGFGGMRDHNGRITLDPRLPVDWEGLSFRITLKGTRVRIDVRQTEVEITVEDGDEAKLAVRGVPVHVREGQPVTVPLAHQGSRDPGQPAAAAIEGGRRSDGTVITSSIPTIAHEADFFDAID
ncbi:glycoside hydrolase family 65 protein [Cryobacterium sp. TMT1-21]|uniref:Glycoside hydrolase family 65 protein n=1 Tax=Cryobacterium shii TaxID=1259235 RepID=A0AAQ2C764_9MICO|nr:MULTISPECIES: glycosyl hydrolase family 65 protein [Cryobacterium]TFC48891.1 glycoside hydrolase family 65 protein [Cryobacterium shii]TFC82952.1 glycoside hydrolase family 65 protein [Cryobacterium sp. TmT2-59]TFD12579.1 glycoside hydrolase family 65 protein [Cryobacterium sp. TMT1-21]TFD17238.1 glycoside hydrolase family 65 protein [Cryobacterium sp. TMT4-10]TFD25743.1 glycoside hydrolase family 65 protein [Cryobacterium sp. TMT2-23]